MRRLVPLALVIACALASPAAAAPGSLTVVDSDVGDPGMGGARGVVVSPDGRHVYVASANLPSASGSAVAVFSRNTTTGVLTYAGCTRTTGSSVDCAATAAGLNQLQYLAVSPVGKNVYTAGGGAV